MSEGEEDDDKRMVSDIEGVRSLGGREMLRSMRDGICVCEVVVVVALMVEKRVVVLMVMVGTVVLVMVVRVSCIGVVGVMVVFCIRALEVD